MQRYFRQNHSDSQSGEKSFRYGPSTSNQRIESWWSQFSNNGMNWWINYFKDLQEKVIIDVSLPYHVQAIRFCFMDILQNELDDLLALWNSHRIRSNSRAECPGGRPDVLFYLPSRVTGNQGGLPVSTTDLTVASRFCSPPPVFGCSTEFLQLATIIMSNNQISFPSNKDQAEHLLIKLLYEIDTL